jgi:hypothetical protein
MQKKKIDTYVILISIKIRFEKQLFVGLGAKNRSYLVLRFFFLFVV